MVAGGSSEAIPPVRHDKELHPGRVPECASSTHHLASRRDAGATARPPGVSSRGAPQPPATFWHPSGMTTNSLRPSSPHPNLSAKNMKNRLPARPETLTARFPNSTARPATPTARNILVTAYKTCRAAYKVCRVAYKTCRSTLQVRPPARDQSPHLPGRSAPLQNYRPQMPGNPAPNRVAVPKCLRHRRTCRACWQTPPLPKQR